MNLSPTEINQPLFWTQAWAEAKAASPLAASQEVAPERWRDFWGRVSRDYLDMFGRPRLHGAKVTELCLAQGLVWPGARVLDVGAGPGTMSLDLAAAGATVTAVDESGPMLAVLTAEAERRGAGRIETREAAFPHLPFGREFDLVVASYFPGSFSPEGLVRLAEFSRGGVVLVLGGGREPFPFRHLIWAKLLEEPLPAPRSQLIFVLGYLLAAGRRPGLKHLSWPVRLDLPVETVAGFYQAYFDLLGLGGDRVGQTIRACLAPFIDHGRVKAQGEEVMAVIWWAADQGAKA